MRVPETGEVWVGRFPAHDDFVVAGVAAGRVLRVRGDGSTDIGGYSLERLHEGWYDPKDSTDG